MIRKLPLTLLSLLFVLSFFSLQSQNPLAQRAFWKNQPKLDTVKALVQEGHDPSILDANAFDPVVWALLEKADFEVIEYLLKLPGNSADKITHDGRTYLFWAAYKANLPVMQWLIENGAQTNMIDDHGYSILNFAAVTGQQDQAVYEFLINNGAQPLQEKSRDGAHALLLLLPHLQNVDLINFLESYGLQLKDLDKNGSGAFHYAAKGGHQKMLDWLQKEGLDPSQLNRNLENAQHFAAQGLRGKTNKLSTFKYLSELGVNPRQVSKTGNTPLTYYLTKDATLETVAYLIQSGVNVNQPTVNGYNALINASARQKPEIIKLLAKHSSNINHTSSKGETALSIALRYNSQAAVETLLKEGAKSAMRDKAGNSLVYYLIKAYQPGNETEFDAKLNMLKKEGVDLTQQQASGNTWYHLAAESSQIYLLEKATKLPLDVNATNNEGLSALHIAALKTNSLASLKLLIGQGANPNLTDPFGQTAYNLAQENELLNAKKEDLEFLKPKS